MAYRILAYERVDDPEGEWIPMVVRMKLDLAGLKIGLTAWHAVSPARRTELFGADASTSAGVEGFALLLGAALREAGADAAAPLPAHKAASVEAWKDPRPAHADVAASLESLGAAGLWDRLDMFGRYVVSSLVSKNADERLAAAVAELTAQPR